VKQLVVLSGKGGTGKTTVTAALAHLASQSAKLVLVDADVDAPNLELLLQPHMLKTVPFFAGKKATIDAALCNECGRCAEVCRFEEIARCLKTYRVVELDCEGCASCFYSCPTGAIRMQDCLSGYWLQSNTRFGSLFHARLAPGAENSGKLVSALRQEALSLAHEQSADWIVIDGAPGIGCAVIAAVTGVDLALLVCEPTVSGVHDLKRALEVCAHFRIPTAVCINKADLNRAKADEIATYCSQENIPMLARIPYDTVAIEAIRCGCAVTELSSNPLSNQLRQLYSGVMREML
jgi:MinD superfamily P-loop ATPase